MRRGICINANAISNLTFSVILACPESFLMKDPRQAGVTKREGFPTSGNDNTKDYVNLLNAFVVKGG
ncbi:MAG TPA: hypothetical protein DEP99_02445 [Nitrospiraceae bacterium]|nr:hypothetical protein [Nitrospiraceae bacterium]